MPISKPNLFASGPLDRKSELRRDAAWIEQRLRDPASRFVPVWRTRSLIKGRQGVVLDGVQAADLLAQADPVVFLGEWQDRAWFALELSTLAQENFSDALRAGEFKDLRFASMGLDRDEAAVLAYARALLYWHRRHRYCGRCGAATMVCEAGHARDCSNAECAKRHFPRTDPSIIVLVTSEHEGQPHCLLGRQAIWPPNVYSTLAGFVEPGESLEDAVAREVFEESGVRVDAVRYHSSQPWPFPAALMLGFHADAALQPVRVDGQELEDARWFAYDEMQAALRAGKLFVPPPMSIAYRLVEGWFDAQGSQKLVDLANWSFTRPAR
ncbi:MAG: NAD(+) diphosphatase [Nevskiales bacterium]